MRKEQAPNVRHDPCPTCSGDLCYVGDVELFVLSLFECERCGTQTVTVAGPKDRVLA